MRCWTCGASLPREANSDRCVSCSQYSRVVRIGRAADNDIVVPEQSVQVSRYQAEVSIGADGSMAIRDVSSAKSTHVDGQPLRGPRAVSTQSSVGFGRKYRLDLAQLHAFRPQPPRNDRANAVAVEYVRCAACGNPKAKGQKCSACGTPTMFND
jgi:pSer/pThr/pTyr-binding forkhead associated (FHA) protein